MPNVDAVHTESSAACGDSLFRRCWRGSRPLTIVGLLMLPVLAVCLAGLVLDNRVITGAPAWMKPAKFAASTAIYALTLAWICSWLTDAPRTTRWVGLITAVVFVLEVAIIDVQAWRGTTSHFNVGTPLDAALFSLMGIGIYTQTAVSVLVAIALWRQRFADAALGTALRAGMIIAILGASTGGLMVTPTAAQLAAVREGARLTASGSHTVGAPDGSPGLPGVGWSLEHGDVRVPHFVGLHAMQVLPFVALLLTRRRVAAAQSYIRAAALSYGALFVLLLSQALRGEGLVSPGTFTLAAFAVWAVGTLAALAAVGARRSATGLSPMPGV